MTQGGVASPGDKRLWANRPGNRRFTAQEDAYLVTAYGYGTSVRKMMEYLGRAKSSICWRLEWLQQKGRIGKRPKFRRRVDVHVRLPASLYQKIEARAAMRSAPMSLTIEDLLRRQLDGPS